MIVSLGDFFQPKEMKIVNLSIAGVSILICLVFAYFLMFTDFKSDVIYGAKRTTLSVIFILYGAFRIYRAYKLYKMNDDE